MLQAYVSSVLDVSYVYCKSKSECYICCKYFLGMLQKFVQNISSVIAIILIWMLYMFHTYVARVCSKCFNCFSVMLQFYVVSCKCFIWMLHIFFTYMLQVYVSSVSSALDVCCIKCFMFQRYVQRVIGAWPERRGMGRDEPGLGRWGALGSCGRGVLVLILTPGSRSRERGGVRGNEGQARCFSRTCVTEQARTSELAEREEGPGRRSARRDIHGRA
jgi:hypothetical protein